MDADYSLYLVTDPSPHLLKGRNIVEVVEAAIRGGVTVVQLREKTADAADIVTVGKRLHVVTTKHGVPLIVNDCIDVALAIGADGEHLGQEDLDIPTARKILGEYAVFGVSVASEAEAEAAVKNGASYLGIGAVYKSPTKEDSKHVLGPEGLKRILAFLTDKQCGRTPTVGIGGIKASNAYGVMWHASHKDQGLSGVAVVSAIKGPADPESAASELRESVQGTLDARDEYRPKPTEPHDLSTTLGQISPIVQSIGQQTPLSHNMTNLVIQNLAANVALAVLSWPATATKRSTLQKSGRPLSSSTWVVATQAAWRIMSWRLRRTTIVGNPFSWTRSAPRPRKRASKPCARYWARDASP